MMKPFLYVAMFSIFSFAQISENGHQMSNYGSELFQDFLYAMHDNYPNFKYFEDVVKKREKKSLYELAHQSYFAMDSTNAYILSGRELRAVNIAVADAPYFGNHPYNESVYIYKLNSEVLYICIELNENEYYKNKPDVFDNTPKKSRKGFYRGGGGGEYLINLKTMTIIEKIGGAGYK